MLSQKEKVLLSFLGVVFLAQITALGFAGYHCSRNGGLKACPDIAANQDVMFTGMTATILALITNLGVNGKGRN